MPLVGSGALADRSPELSLPVMERLTDVLPVRLVDSKAAADPLRLAVAAYMARYTGSSREHASSDLRCFLVWCTERDLDPMAASRAQLELYIRWMQEVRRFKPSRCRGGSRSLRASTARR